MAYQLDVDDKFYAEKYCVNTIIDSLKIYGHISEYINEYPTEFKKFNDEILEYYVKNKQVRIRQIFYQFHKKLVLLRGIGFTGCIKKPEVGRESCFLAIRQ